MESPTSPVSSQEGSSPRRAARDVDSTPRSKACAVVPMDEIRDDDDSATSPVSPTVGDMPMPLWARIVDTAKLGAGLFGDSYDLFVVDAVLATLTEVQKTNSDIEKRQYGFDDASKGAVAAATSFGAVAGMLLFGFLSDRFGRRKLMVATVACVAVGCVACASAVPSDACALTTQLIIFRVLIGVGIGGEYPLSAANSLETSNESTLAHRMLRTARLFSMQGLGMVTAALLATILVGSGMSLSIAWRLMCLGGSIPATFAVVTRLRLVSQGESEEFKKHRASVFELNAAPPLWKQLSDKMWILLTTASLWFLLDVTFYGTGQFRSAIEEKLFGASDSDTSHARLLRLSGFSLVVAVAGLPGYLLSAYYVLKRYDVFTVQLVGFATLAVLYLVIGFFVDVDAPPVLSLVVFCFTFFVTNLGPNMTTFIIPPMMFPVSCRTTAHGIAAASGKLGAAVGGYLLPVLLHTWGLPAVMYSCAAVALVGFGICRLSYAVSDVQLWRTSHAHM